MEKLIELLNERKGSKHYYAVNGSIRTVGQFPVSELELINKKFGFIKRLVDNDKIKKSYKEGLPAITKNGFLLEGETVLLMLLAISDNPIEDLCGYLKDDATEKVDKLLDGAKRTCENIGI